MKQSGFSLIAAVSATILLAGCHTPKYVYAPPATATPANSATVVGTVFSRNAFNSVYSCVTRVDTTYVADPVHNLCKYLAHHEVVIPAGQHKIAISFAAESGQYTSGKSKEVSVDLAAGQVYTVKGELIENDRKVRIWLSNAKNEDVSESATFEVETDWGKLHDNVFGRPPDPTGFASKDMSATLPELHHLLIFGDFGDRSQPFQKAFIAKARDVAAACHVAVDFEMVEHATTLTLDPPKVPTPAELSAKAAALGADGLLRVAVTSWNSEGAYMPPGLDKPLTGGRYSLAVTLSRQPSGISLWSGSYQQKIDYSSGGDLLADHMLHRFAAQGAFPECPAPAAAPR